MVIMTTKMSVGPRRKKELASALRCMPEISTGVISRRSGMEYLEQIIGLH